MPDPPSNAPVFNQALLQAIADEIDVDEGTFLFAVIDQEDSTTSASNGTDTSGEPPTANDLFRIGSFTKVFTALATLTLVDQGLVDLDAPANEYVSLIPVPADVTVRDLLQHTSGIYNYTDSTAFLSAAFEAPGQRWTPQETIGFVADQPALFAPGTRFSYSNTNYLILGVLIEEVTGQPYHQVVRDWIIDPLGMTSTYLAGFEDGPLPFDAPEPDGETTAFETTSWSAGAMVSTPPDLHLLFGALFNSEIISEGLVAQMTVGTDMALGVSPYGLGLDLTHSPRGFYGHSGGIPGYLVLIHHAPEPGVTAFLAATGPQLFTDPVAGLTLEAALSMEMSKALRQLTSS